MSAKKRILIFTSSFPSPRNPVSGIFVEDLARSLVAHFEVVVLAPALPGVARCECRDGMKILRFRQGFGGIVIAGTPGGILPALKRNRLLLLWLPFFLALEFLALMRTVRREKIDLIHAHWLLPQGLLAAIYKTFFNRRMRLLVTCHGSDLLKVGGGVAGRLKRFALRRTDGLTVVSELLRKRAMEAGFRGECRILPMGVDTAVFSPECREPDIRKRYGIEGRMILFVGSLIELKGVRSLVQAMPILLKRIPDATLLLVGGGELEPELRRMAAELGVADRVILAGPVLHEDLPAYFAQSDLFVLPSFSEGWPLVVMEALSSGAIVAVSDLPVFMNHPERDRIFRLFRAGDPADIAAVLGEALADPLGASRRKERREYAVSELDLKMVGMRYADEMNRILEA